MRLKTIITYLENKFPPYMKEEWDNVGLMVGDREQDIKKIQLSLDVTDTVIEHAINNKMDLIITHHPLIFKGINKINSDSSLGRKILKLIKNNIAVYSLHTNLDSGRDGINDYIMKLIFGFENSEILDKKDNENYGIGRVITLDKIYTGKEILELLKEKLSLKNIVTVNLAKDKEIKKIAIITGSGGSYWRKIKANNIDLFITGDIKYHEALDMREEGVSAVDIGHFESEHIFVNIIKELLDNRFDGEIKIFNDGPILNKE